MRVRAYEGERPNVEHNNLLGVFYLEGLPRAPRGDVKIIISMQIDVDGIVKVSAEHKTSGIKDAMTVTNPSSRLRENEIAKMMAEAEKLKVEDQRWKERVELRNALDQYIYGMKKRLNMEKRWGDMQKEDVEDMEAGLEEAEEWLSEHENAVKDELAEKMKDVRRLCRKIVKS